MFFVYQILSGEKWNERTRVEDFKEVSLVKIAQDFKQIEEYAGRDDIFIDAKY